MSIALRHFSAALQKISVGQAIHSMVISPLRPMFFLIVSPAAKPFAAPRTMVGVHMHRLRKEVLVRFPVCGQMALAPDGRTIGLLLRSSFLLYNILDHSSERSGAPRVRMCFGRGTEKGGGEGCSHQQNKCAEVPHLNAPYSSPAGELPPYSFPCQTGDEDIAEDYPDCLAQARAKQCAVGLAERIVANETFALLKCIPVTCRFFHGRPLVSIAFHPREPLVATGDCLGHLTLWHLGSRGTGSTAGTNPGADGRPMLSPSARMRSTVVSRAALKSSDEPGAAKRARHEGKRIVSVGAAPLRTDEHWHSSELRGVVFTPGGEIVLTVGNEVRRGGWEEIGREKRDGMGD